MRKEKLERLYNEYGFEMMIERNKNVINDSVLLEKVKNDNEETMSIVDTYEKNISLSTIHEILECYKIVRAYPGLSLKEILVCSYYEAKNETVSKELAPIIDSL
ncbi:hypothetical protein CPT_Madawaska_235 [Staphylococcus phage Madawaska]|nr:hypothetical protein CPT_Madawaska_235 [Staphylococcus phage Madawaska]